MIGTDKFTKAELRVLAHMHEHKAYQIRHDRVWTLDQEAVMKLWRKDFLTEVPSPTPQLSRRYVLSSGYEKLASQCAVLLALLRME